MTKLEFLKQVYEKYNLDKDEDIFKVHNTHIITKTGIQKIASAEGFKYDFDVIESQPDYSAVKCTISKDGDVLSRSFGSAEKANVKNAQKYYLEMAEKRAKARAILIAIDAHGYLYSEEEADDFKQQPQVIARPQEPQAEDAGFGEHYHIVKAKLLNEPSNGRKALLARALTSDKVVLTDEEKTALKAMLP
jgi:hypothetical protein